VIFADPFTDTKPDSMPILLEIPDASTTYGHDYYTYLFTRTETPTKLQSDIQDDNSTASQIREIRLAMAFRYIMLGIDNTTSPRIPSEDPRREIADLFNEARNEFFEDGTESNFSRNLNSIIVKHGTTAVDEIARLITNHQTDPEVTSEALRRMATLTHLPTYHTRLQLLAGTLYSLDPRIRYGAALGLASLDDPATIPYVKRAIEREPIQDIQMVMNQVLAQLEGTKDARASEKDKIKSLAKA
jgi:hypothetical protein